MGYAVKAHVRWCPNSVVTEMYNRLRARHKPYNKVIVACSRKMLDVIWSVLKNGRPFTDDRELLRKARGEAAEIENIECAMRMTEIEARYAEVS